VPSNAIVDYGPPGDDPEEFRRAVEGKRRMERPRAVSELDWKRYSIKWTHRMERAKAEAAERRERTSPAAARRRYAEAEAARHRAAEERRARAAQSKADAEAWECPEHRTRSLFVFDWSGDWTSSCQVRGCPRRFPPLPTIDPAELEAEDPNGWQCPTHGLHSISRTTWDKGRTSRGCTLCEADELFNPEGESAEERSATIIASSKADRARKERERQAARRAEVERVAALPRCAHCGVDIESHERTTADHRFDASRVTQARLAITKVAVFAGIVAALYFFFMSGATPGAPFHELTGQLLCAWDWKGTACP